MTDQELLQEIRAFRKDLADTRKAVEALARTSFRQKVFNVLVIVLFVTMVVGGWLVFKNAESDRDAIRHEACVANQTSVRKARLANQIFFNTLVAVLVEPGNTEDQNRADSLGEELARQQDDLLPIPKCD